MSGTGQVLGDVELRLRGQGMAVTRGVFYGFIDSSVVGDAAQGANRTAAAVEVSAEAPDAWRP